MGYIFIFCIHIQLDFRDHARSSMSKDIQSYFNHCLEFSSFFFWLGPGKVLFPFYRHWTLRIVLHCVGHVLYILGQDLLSRVHWLAKNHCEKCFLPASSNIHRPATQIQIDCPSTAIWCHTSYLCRHKILIETNNALSNTTLWPIDFLNSSHNVGIMYWSGLKWLRSWLGWIQ